MMATAGMKLTVFMLLADSKFSDGGCRWSEADSLDAVGLIACKFSDGGWSWNETDSHDALGLTVGEFSLMVAAAGMKLTVLMLLA